MSLQTIEGERLDIRRVRERLGSALLNVKNDRGEIYLIIERTALVDTILALKNDPDLKYDYFAECVGVDYSAWQFERDLPNRFEVVYNIMSVTHATRLFIKVGVDDGQTVATLKHIFLGAEYPEKEISDLYGIQFEGNPVTGGRFLLPDDWVGYPLRKDVPLGGEDVVFHEDTTGPAVEDIAMPHAGESFEGKTGSEDISGR